MPTTRSANKPQQKRAISPDSNDEEDEFTLKKSTSTRGRRGENKRGGSMRGRGGRGGAKAASTGKPPAKRGRKKKTNNSDSEDEKNNFDSDHLHDELKKCHSLLVELAKDKHEAYAFPFKKPVDTAALGLLDYHEVVKKPMDLLTMKKKLIGEEYDTAVEFKEDFKLIISNCLLYNNRGDPVSQMAFQLRNAFAAKWRSLFPEDEDDFGKKDDEAAEDDEEEDEGEEEGTEKKIEEKEQQEETDGTAEKEKEGGGESLGHIETTTSGAISPKSNVSEQSSDSNDSSHPPTNEVNESEETNEADSATRAAQADSTTEENTD